MPKKTISFATGDIEFCHKGQITWTHDNQCMSGNFNSLNTDTEFQ